MTFPKPFLLAAALVFACGVATAPLRAQVSYVRDLSFTPDGAVLSLGQAPVDTSDPLYAPGQADTQWIFTSKFYYSFNINTGVASAPIFLPSSIRVSTNSLVSMSGLGTTAPYQLVLGNRSSLFSMDVATHAVVSAQTVLVSEASSLVAQGGRINLIADGNGYSVDPGTGAVSAIFALNGGTGLGDFSLQTRYQSYGADGLLYVLDYGNGRMQMLDPEASFAPVGSFQLAPGVTTANQQFTIGSTGHIYLGDGVGGGFTYAADGTYLGAFTLPGAVTGTPPPEESNSYLGTDQNGGVYVFDATGFHQYRDLSVVPEPSASALVLAAAGLIAGFSRRKRRQSAGVAQAR